MVRRLTADEVRELVAAYEAGSTAYELAGQFGVHRVTVTSLLHRSGVVMRRCGLSKEQINETVALYRQGWPVARIGKHFGVDGTTVWRALRQLGVPMRRPWERGEAD
jgi:transcriptional regulator of acetoin/glycerol metabolism